MHNACILNCFIWAIYYKQNISQQIDMFFLISKILLTSFVNKYQFSKILEIK